MSNLPPLSQYVALDCEMITLRYGTKDSDGSHAVAKVGIVDHEGNTLLDTFVFVQHEDVLNYNTKSSGVNPSDLVDAPKFDEVRAKVRAILKGKILVAHAAFNDLAVLKIRFPQDKMRDTALYYPIRALLDVKAEGQYPGLKHLSKKVLGKEIQEGKHCPVVDAQTTMALYIHFREDWEVSLMRDEDVTAAVPGHFSEWYF